MAQPHKIITRIVFKYLFRLFLTCFFPKTPATLKNNGRAKKASCADCEMRASYLHPKIADTRRRSLQLSCKSSRAEGGRSSGLRSTMICFETSSNVFADDVTVTLAKPDGILPISHFARLELEEKRSSASDH